jgi:hypothetical protein
LKKIVEETRSEFSGDAATPSRRRRRLLKVRIDGQSGRRRTLPAKIVEADRLPIRIDRDGNEVAGRIRIEI